MKVIKFNIAVIAFVMFLIGCDLKKDTTIETKANAYANVVKEYDPSDSITTFSYWINENEADVYQIGFNKDTVSQYKYKINKLYHNYTYYDKAGNIEKIYQYIKLKGNFRINESLKFSSNNEIVRDESDVIETKINENHIVILNHNKSIYNKLRVIAGDTLTFEREKWQNVDTLVSFTDSIVVPFSYQNRCCIVQLITTDKAGNDLSGRDFFFDVNTLKCRDIKKSLVCE